MRSERIEIVLAFAGLLFACISAALIVAFAIPQPKTVVERIFQSALDVADTFAPLEMQIDLLVMPKMLKVGSHRRRLGELLNESDNSPTPTQKLPPNEVVVQHDAEHMEGESTTRTVTDTVPAVMVGVASSIILCALMLYTADMRGRLKGSDEKRGGQADDEVETSIDRDTISGSTLSGSGPFVHTRQYGNPGDLILPPLVVNDSDTAEKDYPEDLSISRVSTLTQSMMESHIYSNYSFGVVESKAGSLSNSSVVTELSDENRVTQHTALITLMKDEECPPAPASPCSSLSSSVNSDDSALLGENLPDAIAPHTPTGLSSPFEYTPADKGKVDEGDAKRKRVKYTTDTDAQLEHLVTNTPLNELWIRPSLVRDVYLVPHGKMGHVGSGLHLGSAGPNCYPHVEAVDSPSSVAGLVVIGDRILSIGDTSTAGLSVEETLVLIELCLTLGDIHNGEVKMTVCRTPSGSGSFSDGDDRNSFDYGVPDSFTEV